MRRCLLLNLDTVEYGKAWQFQRNLCEVPAIEKEINTRLEKLFKEVRGS